VVAQAGDLLGGEAEQEEAVVAHLLADLDVRTVEGADGDRAVHHELHVPGARGLLAGGRNLLGKVVAGQIASMADTRCPQERHAQQLLHRRVAVHSQATLLISLMISLARA